MHSQGMDVSELGESTCLPSHLWTVISVPDVDLRQPGGPECLVQLAAVVDVVGEDALEDGSRGCAPSPRRNPRGGSPRRACRGSTSPGSARRSGRLRPAPRRVPRRETWSRSSSPGQLLAAFVNGVVSAPGSPAKSQSQNTRWQAAWPTVAQIGQRSDAGRIANCSSVNAATTSRRRWFHRGHVTKAGRIVRLLMSPRYREVPASRMTHWLVDPQRTRGRVLPLHPLLQLGFTRLNRSTSAPSTDARVVVRAAGRSPGPPVRVR